MSKYGVSDQNKIMMFYESGTYATPVATAAWIGLVTNHDPNENLNVIPLRFVAGTGRNVNQFVQTFEEYDGTLAFHPQDFRFLKFALGSCVDGGSPTYRHLVSEQNSADSSFEIADQHLPSFSIEDIHVTTTGSNFKRTIKGAMVDTMTINAPQGDMMTVEIGYTAQSCTFASGAATSVTARTNRPFLTQDSQLIIGSPDIGPAYPTIKNWSLEINNNVSKNKYADGTTTRGVGIPTGRDYTLNLTLVENDNQTKFLYDKYYKGGSEFNAEIRIKTANAGLGSAFMFLSGCEIVDMKDPTGPEGENEINLVVRPTSMNGDVYDNIQYWNNTSGPGF